MVGQDKTFITTDPPGKVNEETILKIAKEITVKFIEVGRVTPTNFSSIFNNIYNTIDKTVRGNRS